MAKQSRRNKAGRRAPAETPGTTKTLAQMAYEETVTSTVQSWKRNLPAGFTPNDLADLVHRYLNYCKEKVRTKPGVMMEAGMLVAHFRPPWTGDNWEIIDQEDFKKWAAPLLENSDFLLIADRIKPLRAKSTELYISWEEAEPILKQNVDKLLRRDKRPLKVQRGELLAQIISELKQINDRRDEFCDFDQLIEKFPQFEVVRMHQRETYTDDDRAYFANPSEWETRPGSYSQTILDKYWGAKSKETYKSYRHAFNSRKR